jgi:rhodanese-related sulfurtransferase
MAELPLEISCSEVHQLRESGAEALVVDCREPDEHAAASIAGAVLLPMSQIVDRVGELAEWQGRRVVVHCHLGGRSRKVAAWLRDQGFGQAQSMAGGIDQWAVEIDPGVGRY